MLKCEGRVSSLRPAWTKSNQSIAVRIKKGKITFSGNDYLRGDDIQICHEGDDLYFDSDTCAALKTTQTRQYGTFNKILMRLDLTNTIEREGLFIHLSGRFTCVHVEGPS